MADLDFDNVARGDRSVTAFFDSQAGADRARADLIAAGLSPDSISVAGGQNAHEAAPDDGGFWHALKEFFMPDEDRYTYAEGLRRGGYAVSVKTSQGHYDRALDILDADGAVDIDERQKEWRNDGWAGYPAGMDPTSAGLGYMGADAGTAGFGASMAGEDGYAPPASTTTTGTVEAETRGDSSRVGTGTGEPGLLNPDMRERINAGTASMTPPTPTGAQGDAVRGDAADLDRSRVSPAAQAEADALGSPTRSGLEAPSALSTVGSVRSAKADRSAALDVGTQPVRRDDSVQRARVRGYIADPLTGNPIGR